MQEPIYHIAFIECNIEVIATFTTVYADKIKVYEFSNGLELFKYWQRKKTQFSAIISQSEILGVNGISLMETLEKKRFPRIPFCIVLPAGNIRHANKLLALDAGVAEIFPLPLNIEKVNTRLTFLMEHWSELSENSQLKTFKEYKTPWNKRFFDIVFSGIALLLLSPFFLIIYILIVLESGRPAFYYSLRVGTGYKIFKFYKFRSMYKDADKRLKDLKHLNQYNASQTEEETEITLNDKGIILCDECRKAGTSCKYPFYSDTHQWCEKEYSDAKKSAAGSAFIKLKDDPRITKVGKFIRNTSIDELPQLWNVFIGNMSIVGNRPLPLYEAEKLTTDKYSLRFLAPAGITGLWQVVKRGKGEMSEEERLLLDNIYAKKYSFLFDLKLILMTIPALFQKENV